MKKQEKGMLNSCVALFVLFLLLSLMFPYTGDDWAWGSSIGVERLEVFFKNYNGRYLGNLLVFALTRNKVLDAVVMAVSFTLISYFCYAYSANKSKMLFWVAAILFFSMPKEIFAQSIVWTAGYSNYVPSALISAIFLLSARKVTQVNPPAPDKKPGKNIWMFVLGFCGGLFIEHITLFNIYFTAGVIIYAFVRFKKYYKEHFAFLIGAIVGACAMFSDPSYLTIIQGGHKHKQIPQGVDKIVEMIVEHIQMILTYIIYDNLFMCAVVTVVLLVLAVVWKKAKTDHKDESLITAVFHSICFLLICSRDYLWALVQKVVELEERAVLLMDSAMALLYVFSILLMVLHYVEKERKARMLLPFIGVVGSLMPVVLVNPFGPRCVFSGYFLMMIFVVDLIGYLKNQLVPAEKWFSRVACLIVVTQFMVAARIFAPIAYYDHVRTEFVKNQVAAGDEKIWVFDLPNSDYLWNSLPRGNTLTTRYKLFYELDEDLEIRDISYEEIAWMIEEYNLK